MASADEFAVGYTGPNEISGWVAVLVLWFALQVIIYAMASVASRHARGIIFFEAMFFAAFAAITTYLLLTKNERGVLLAKAYLAARLCTLVIEIVRVGNTGLLRAGYGICVPILCVSLRHSLTTQEHLLLPRYQLLRNGAGSTDRCNTI